jgi:hypothetical protein
MKLDHGSIGTNISQALGLQHICNSFRSLDPALHENERIATIRYHSTRDQNCHTHVWIQGLFYESTDTAPSLGAFCQTSLVLPVRLFFTEPIVFLASIMASTSSAVIYLFPEAFPVVFKVAFGFSLRQCSLVNLAIPVGVIFTFLPRLYDIRTLNDCRRRSIVAEPEDKIFGFLVAAPILAVAFWWFGLTVPPIATGLSPWIPIASLALVGFSVVEFDTVLAGYLTDTYTSHAASANASLSFLRAVLSGVLPLFGHSMFEGLGPNNAMFVLASFATLYCGVAVLFGMYGKRIRLRSRFAQHEVGKTVDSNVSV